MTQTEATLRPYIMGRIGGCRPLLERCPLPDPYVCDIFSPQGLNFYRLVNAGNNHAFGGLGMPPWVQLDCATLPTAMIGYAITRDEVEPPLWQALVAQVERQFGSQAVADLRGYQGLVPISEYCAAATFEPGVVVGFSLFALRKGLGIRTKALAMACYGAKRQIGVTQYPNRSVSAHCAFGPLRLMDPRTLAHSRPEDSFTYELVFNDPQHLLALIEHGDKARHPPMDAEFEVEVRPEKTAREVEALIAKHGPLAIAPPGLRRGETRTMLGLIRVSEPES